VIHLSAVVARRLSRDPELVLCEHLGVRDDNIVEVDLMITFSCIPLVDTQSVDP
jgi:hypothetical protein